MEPNNSGRKRNITGTVTVHKKGSAVGGGPVGRQDGYAGRKAASSCGSGRAGSTGGGTGLSLPGGRGGLLIAIIVILLGGGGGLTAFLTGGLGGGSDDDYSSGYEQSYDPDYSTTAASQNTAAQANTGGNLASALYTGYTGNNGLSSGWDTDSNVGVLNKEVASGTPAKRTQIIGNGQDVITFMVYMCGTDLESKSGMASNDLMEMAKANLSDKINIIVYTGGCSGWKTSGISNRVNQIYKVENGQLKQLVADDGDKPMTDPATLTAFIKYCKENYPANRNNLIFWDHGGGSITGYGYDEKHKSSGSMNLTGINKALKDAGMTFDFIGFDACLMATLETGFMASNYADYLIASEETEPGIGWYYTDWLNKLSQDTSMPTVEIGKNIVDGFIDECKRKCGRQKTTLSVVDLAELSYTVPDKLNKFSVNTADIIKSDDYKLVADARVDAREFAVSSKIDQIDLVNFANEIGTQEAKELSSSLLSAVKYNRTSGSMTNAYGISIYFPYKKTSSVSSAVNTYSLIGMDDEYGKCIQSFAGLESSGQITAGGAMSPVGSLLGSFTGGGLSGSDAIGNLLGAFLGGRSVPGVENADYMQDETVFNVDQAANYVAENQFDSSKLVWQKDGDDYVMAIEDDQWALIKSLQENLFVDDGEGYIDLGLDNVYHFTDNGLLIGDKSKAWMAIDGQPVAYYYEDTTVDVETGTVYTYGRVPVLIDSQRANLIIVFEIDMSNEDPETATKSYIAGARFDYVDGETEAVAKGVTEIEPGSLIEYVADYYTYDDVYDGSYVLSDAIEYSEDMEISDVIIDQDCKTTYLLTDIYAQEYWTPAVP